ncbi:hypothetical protein ALPR1_11345 [Algoriphagus machipongonensis]|uniref:Outer membrane protein beta-barrel domain-containing protein n=2 Tax=Algoriphagus machipongonensis TaxID=388413 RepID=A3HSJ0_9BACT|nr:hypothetical protein ALPR1_11345 [Algoriphagus machipongonensis]
MLVSMEIHAQKYDYIVFADTIQTDGYIKNYPIENNTAIFFKKIKREEYKKYTIEEVTEFYVNHRYFFKKEISLSGEMKIIFLQLIPQPNPAIKLWKFSAEKDYYFLEDSMGLNQLNEESYQEVLSELIDNPIIDPLIDITQLEEYSLYYLFQTATTIIKPRSYSKVFTISPNVGYNLVKQEFSLPNIGLVNRINAETPTFGINLEVFVNPMRNISVNLNPNWSKVNTNQFQFNSEGKLNFEIDYYLDYSVFTLPVSGKYYIDIKPNAWRGFFELGYSVGIFNYEKLVFYRAEVDGKSITTIAGDFELEPIYQGLVWGIGLEKYFKHSRAISIGLKNYHLSASVNEKYLRTGGYLSFKF